MGFPEDAIQPLLNCMAPPPYTWPAIAGPGGLPNHALASFSSMLGGINFILDFIPPDPGNLPSPPTFDLFSAPFLGALNIPGDLGELDLGLVIPGAPKIPATGPDIQYDQGGHIKLILVSIGVPFGIIDLMVSKIISDLEIAIPGVPDIVDLFGTLGAGVGLSGPAIPNFAGCFAQGCFDMLTALIPV